MEQTTPKTEVLAGLRDMIPMIVGAIPFGIIFGAVAVTGGLSPAATQGMSLFVFAGSAQFIAAGLIAEGIPAGIIVLTTFIVNLRHALYGASLAPYLKHLPQKWLVPFGFLLTDETYAVAIRRYQEHGVGPYGHWYYLASALFMYANWQVCTLIGIVAGRSLQGAANWGLDFAMVATFIGITVPLIANRPMLICTLVAGVTAVLANGLPNKLGLMLAALLGIGAGVLAESIQPGGQAETVVARGDV
jgi:4-azaleucine resistance transporter AzlC